MTRGKEIRWQAATLAAAIGLALGSATFGQSDIKRGHDTAPQAEGRTGAPSQRPAEARQSQQQQTVERGVLADFDDLAHVHAELSSFAAAVKTAGLENSLTNGKDYTVFAPTNEALEEKPGKDLDALLEPENREELVSFLRAHIVADEIDLQSPRHADEAKTIDGEAIDIEHDDGVVKIGGARVVNASGIAMGNLKIYAIDDVLARSGTPIEEGQVFNRNSGASAPSRAPRIARNDDGR
jgi:uncharacterized surface protein with fasciclin (FAS1) repeats